MPQPPTGIVVEVVVLVVVLVVVVERVLLVGGGETGVPLAPPPLTARTAFVDPPITGWTFPTAKSTAQKNRGALKLV